MVETARSFASRTRSIKKLGHFFHICNKITPYIRDWYEWKGEWRTFTPQRPQIGRQTEPQDIYHTSLSYTNGVPSLNYFLLILYLFLNYFGSFLQFLILFFRVFQSFLKFFKVFRIFSQFNFYRFFSNTGLDLTGLEPSYLPTQHLPCRTPRLTKLLSYINLVNLEYIYSRKIIDGYCP